MKLKLIVCLLLLLTRPVKAQLSVTPLNNDSAMINYLQGFGLTITNMTISADSSAIAFYSGSSPMAFGSGVIMSTGIMSDSMLNRPAWYMLSSEGSNRTDSDLAAVMNLSTTDIHDACIIEFDCVPDYAQLVFDFAFGSEEYNDYVNSNFNDVFAIMFSGQDTNGVTTSQNLAVVPGTSLPVSVNTINNGSSVWNATATGPCTNCQYYYDNINSTSFVLDGFTTGLQGTANVVPGQTYHFKIAIADVYDQLMDSYVMFLANSFRTIAPVDIKDTGVKSRITLFPNPATDYFNIHTSGLTIEKTEVYSMDGRLAQVSFSENSVNIEALSKGVYTVYIYFNGEKVIRRLVIE